MTRYRKLTIMLLSTLLSINPHASFAEDIENLTPHLSQPERDATIKYGKRLAHYHRHFQSVSVIEEQAMLKTMVTAVETAKHKHMQKNKVTGNTPELEALIIRKVEEQYGRHIAGMFLDLSQNKGYFEFAMYAHNEFHHYALIEDTLNDSMLMTAALYATTYHKRNGLPNDPQSSQTTMNRFTERAETMAGIQNYIHMKRFNLTQDELQKSYRENNYSNEKLMKKVLTNELYSQN